LKRKVKSIIYWFIYVEFRSSFTTYSYLYIIITYMQLPSIQIAMDDPGLPLRLVVPGGAGSAMTPPQFGRSANPISISTKGGRLCPPNNTGTPGFTDLPTALPLRKNDIPQAQ
jgi:hypothetical protein